MKCAFCNALPKPDWDGCDLNWFHCGTMYPYGKPCKLDQTAQCQEAEREQLNTSIERLKKAGDAMVENGSVSERMAKEWNEAKGLK